MDTAWVPMVDYISKWMTGGDGVRLGHLQAPHASGKSAFVPRALWASVCERDRDVFVVHAVPEIEVSRLDSIADIEDDVGGWHRSLLREVVKRRRAPRPRWHMKVCSFGAFTALIEDQLLHLKTKGCVETPWDHPLVAIVDIDQQCPADLALLLIAIMTWAFPSTGVCASQSVTLLTMSASEPPAYLERLYKCYHQTMDRFNMRAKALSRPITSTHTAGPLEEVLMAIKTVIQERKGQSHGLLVLGSNPTLVDVTIATDTSARCVLQPTGAHLPEDGQRDEERRKQALKCDWEASEAGDRRIRTIFIDKAGCWHLRGHIEGFQNLHLVLPENRQRTILDRKTGQMVTITTPLSRQERQDLVMWTRRSSATAIYTYLPEPDRSGTKLQDYLNGPEHSRIDTAGHQVLGFVCSLVRFQPWTKHTEEMAQAFVDDDILQLAIRRCVFLGLISVSKSTGRPGLLMESSLPFNVLNCFRQVLATCNYNAQLALFLALPSPNPSALAVKIDLASILTTGINNIVGWERMDDIENRSSLAATAVRSCSGLTFSYANHGNMWVLVGLWQRCMTAIERDDEEMELFQLGFPTRNLLTIPEAGFMIEPSYALQAWKVLKRLRELMANCNLEVSPRTDPTKELSEAHGMMLHKQLVQCFMHHLGVAEVIAGGKAMVTEFTVTGRIAVGTFGIHKTVDWVRWQNAEGAADDKGRLQGIHVSPLRRARGSGFEVFDDWNWVSTSMMADWIREWLVGNPGGNPFHHLRAGCAAFTNMDELQ